MCERKALPSVTGTWLLAWGCQRMYAGLTWMIVLHSLQWCTRREKGGRAMVKALIVVFGPLADSEDCRISFFRLLQVGPCPAWLIVHDFNFKIAEYSNFWITSSSYLHGVEFRLSVNDLTTPSTPISTSAHFLLSSNPALLSYNFTTTPNVFNTPLNLKPRRLLLAQKGRKGRKKKLPTVRCPSYPQLELRKPMREKQSYGPRRSTADKARNCIWCNTWSELDARRIPLSHVPNEGQEWAGHKKDYSAFNVGHTFPVGGSDSATIIYWDYDKL